jgi:hypothetical protein
LAAERIRCSLYRCAPPKIDKSTSWSPIVILSGLLGITTYTLPSTFYTRGLYQPQAYVSKSARFYRGTVNVKGKDFQVDFL